MNRRGHVIRLALLLLILAAAALLRFTGINWDQFQHVHPDERFIVWVADTVTWPADAAAVLDPARSPLNPLRWPPDPANPNNELAGQPRNYAYGHFPLYLLVGTAHLVRAVATWLGETTLAFPAWMQPLHTVGRQMTGYNYLPLVGRAISALADLGTLVLVYALARRLVGHEISGPSGVEASAGLKARREQPAKASIPEDSSALLRFLPLLAAAAYAFAVLPIQLSHFAAVDAVLTFCVTATLALAVRRAEGGGKVAWLLAGAMAGLAVGSKFSAVLLAVPLLVASLYRLPAGTRRRRATVVVGRLAAVAGTAFLAFAVTNPFALIEARAYAMQIFTQNAMVSGLMDAPYTRQYIGRLPYLYFVQQLSQWGLGWPLGIAAWGGFLWAIVRALRWRKADSSPTLIILLAWAVPYFATTGAFHAKFLRYMAPLLPCLLVFAAGWAAAGWRWLAGRFGGWGRAAWGLAAGLTLAITVAWALAFTGVYRQEHPWIAASRWIYANIPAGAKVLTEHWDDALPLALDELASRPVKRAYNGAELPLWDPDTTQKLDVLVTELNTADYLILASNRLYAPMQRLRNRYPMGSQYYRMLFAGDLGYRQVAEFTAYPNLLGLTIRDDHADESFTVYDHPRVLIFENVGRYKPELLRARLGRYLPAGVSSAASDDKAAEYPCENARAEHPERSGAELKGRSGCQLGLHPSTGRSPLSVLTGRPAQDAYAFSGQMAMSRAATRPLRVKMPTGIEPSGGSRRCGPNRLKPRFQAVGELFSELDACLCMHSRRSAADLASNFRLTAPGRTPGLARLTPQAAAPGSALLDQPVDTLPVVADFRWNRLASDSAALAALLWWLAVSLFGWAVWPLLFPLLRGLADRGYGLARPAGWLLVGWVHWLGVSLGWWENRLLAIALILGVLVIAGLVAWRIQRQEVAVFWSRRRRLILGIELLFGLAYLALVGVRLLNPDLWHPWNGGEKFMESAFLNAILRSAHFPPYDPYFAGGIINYYYYGFYLVGLPIKLTGIAPEVAFNLAVPALFALTAGGVFSVAYTLAASRAVNVRTRTRSDERGSQHVARVSKPPYLTNSDRSKHAAVRNGRSARKVFDYGLSPSAHVKRSPRRSQRHNARPALTALLSVGMALVMGNLKGLDWLSGALGSLLRGIALPQYDYWAASRVIPFTINEFPLWTFTFADLHPHLIAMPFGLLVVGLALNWVMVRGQGAGVRRQASGVTGQASVVTGQASVVSRQPSVVNGQPSAVGRRPSVVSKSSPLLVFLFPRLLVSLSICLLLALSLGALGAINTWDVPTYGLLVAGAFLLAGRRRASSASAGVEALAGPSLDAGNRLTRKEAGAQPRFRGEFVIAFGLLLLVAGLSLAAYWPFHANYDPTLGDRAGSLVARYLSWVRAASPLGDWLTVWGVWLFLIAGYLAAAWRGVWRQRRPARVVAGAEGEAPARRRDGPLFALLALIGLLAVLAALGRPTAALAALPACLLLPLIFRRRAPVEGRFVALLVALALAVVVGTELVYVRDFLEGGEWYRMNTLFKFYTPAWLLLGVAGGPMLRQAWAAARRVPLAVGVPWQAVMVALLAGSLTFLAAGVQARVDDRFPGRRPPFGTLDGTAYMTVGSYIWPTADNVIELRHEREAIRWLLDNVQGTPVIAEAPAGWYPLGSGFQGYDYYRAGGLRVASFTGLPTFLGAHQGEQRSGEQVGQREQQGRLFFSTTDIAQERVLMRDLRVGYVYIGQLERTLFDADALRKFDVMVELGDLQVVYRNPQVTIYRVAW